MKPLSRWFTQMALLRLPILSNRLSAFCRQSTRAHARGVSIYLLFRYRSTEFLRRSRYLRNEITGGVSRSLPTAYPVVSYLKVTEPNVVSGTGSTTRFVLRALNSFGLRTTRATRNGFVLKVKNLVVTSRKALSAKLDVGTPQTPRPPCGPLCSCVKPLTPRRQCEYASWRVAQTAEERRELKRQRYMAKMARMSEAEKDEYLAQQRARKQREAQARYAREDEANRAAGLPTRAELAAERTRRRDARHTGYLARKAARLSPEAMAERSEALKRARMERHNEQRRAQRRENARKINYCYVCKTTQVRRKDNRCYPCAMRQVREANAMASAARKEARQASVVAAQTNPERHHKGESAAVGRSKDAKQQQAAVAKRRNTRKWYMEYSPGLLWALEYPCHGVSATQPCEYGKDGLPRRILEPGKCYQCATGRKPGLMAKVWPPVLEELVAIESEVSESVIEFGRLVEAVA